MFFVVIIVFLAGSWVFKYPDTIAGAVEITSDKPPAEVKARTSGKIDTIFVVNNQKVSKGQLLGIIENPASFDEVNRLKRILQENVHAASDSIPPEISIENAGNKLGELQQFYTALRTSQHALSTFTRIGYHAEQIAIL
ncbi:biotin/lipoyl-binding protein, partial [Arthrospira platensis SPKY1]|nr:biotin/lipoyl-binding protein [Arthrospira platensis SPKY1]